MHNDIHGKLIDNQYQDEISISDLLKKLWQRRGLIIVFPLVSLLLAVIFLFFTAIKTNSPTVFFVKLQGIEKSSYPNGARFSPQDLRIPEVLERAVKPLNILVDDTLRNAIQVEYGVPTTAGIQKKYQQKLASKQLSTTDIEQINIDYLEELQSVSERGLRITIDHTSLGLSPEQAAVLASSLPRAWTNIYTQKYRVFVDSRLDHASVVNNENLLNTTSDILLARNTLSRINHGLDVLIADSRLKSLVSQSGFNGSDLLSRLQRFKDLYFRVIYDAVFSNPDEVANTFLAETQLQIDEINRNIEELNRSLIDIQNFRPQTFNRQESNDLRESIQLGENTLDQVINLADQASLSDYLRQILTDRRNLVAKRASLETDLQRSEVSFAPQNNEELWNRARAEYSSLSKEYVSLLTIARDSSKRNYGDFYQPYDAPNSVTSTFPPKTSLVLALSIMLGGFVAIMVALVWPSRS